MLQESPKVLLVLVAGVGIQPAHTPPDKIGCQGDSLVGGRDDQMTNDRERVADCNRYVDVVAFDGVEVWVRSFGERPGQAWFVVNRHRSSHSLHRRVGDGHPRVAAGVATKVAQARKGHVGGADPPPMRRRQVESLAARRDRRMFVAVG
jgi:hypothetical protein